MRLVQSDLNRKLIYILLRIMRGLEYTGTGEQEEYSSLRSRTEV